jgi:hypothetical protein
MKTLDEKNTRRNDPANRGRRGSNAADLAIIGTGLLITSGAAMCALLSWSAVLGYVAGAVMACVAAAILVNAIE